MEVAAGRRLGSGLEGLTVAVQGLGNVGYRLCRLLHEAGARLIVADPRDGVADRAAAELGASVVPAAELLDVPADIVAPCALGGVLTPDSAARLQAAVVCGGANNQLAAPPWVRRWRRAASSMRPTMSSTRAVSSTSRPSIWDGTPPRWCGASTRSRRRSPKCSTPRRRGACRPAMPPTNWRAA
ncbi:MAG: hypothetical protein WDN24_12265 [Sphingomonas sp.]